MTGSEIRKWREDNNISGAELARLLGCHTTTIYRWEIENCRPSKAYMKKLLSVVNKSFVEVEAPTDRNIYFPWPEQGGIDICCTKINNGTTPLYTVRTEFAANMLCQILNTVHEKYTVDPFYWRLAFSVILKEKL